MIRTADPRTDAPVLADELGVPLAMGGTAVESAVGSWTGIRGSKATGDHDRASDGRPQPRRHRTLDELAEATRRTGEVLDRTRTRATEAISKSVTTALAIHPETLRRAAEAHSEALATRDRLRQKPRRSRIVLPVAVLALGAAAIGNVLVAPVVGVAAAGAVLGTGGIAAALHGRRRGPKLEAADAALAETRRRWEALAGLGTDPADVEEVIRRHDPQAAVPADLAALSPAVRAAAKVAQDQQVAWVREWRRTIEARGAGSPTPHRPAAPGGDQPITDQVRSLLGDSTPTSVVLADLYSGLSPQRAAAVHGELLLVPEGIHLVIVLGPAEDAAESPTPAGAGGTERRSGSFRTRRGPRRQRGSGTEPRRPIEAISARVVDLAASEAVAPGAPGTTVRPADDRDRPDLSV